jgi:hypothetical protein
MWTLQNRWMPAVNAIGEKHNWPRWDVLEIAEEIRDARNDILKKLHAAPLVPSPVLRGRTSLDSHGRPTA